MEYFERNTSPHDFCTSFLIKEHLYLTSYSKPKMNFNDSLVSFSTRTEYFKLQSVKLLHLFPVLKAYYYCSYCIIQESLELCHNMNDEHFEKKHYQTLETRSSSFIFEEVSLWCFLCIISLCPRIQYALGKFPLFYIDSKCLKTYTKSNITLRITFLFLTMSLISQSHHKSYYFHFSYKNKIISKTYLQCIKMQKYLFLI